MNEGVKLVYMTTHPVDEGLYVGEREKMMEGYAARDPAFVDRCVQGVSDAVFLKIWCIFSWRALEW